MGLGDQAVPSACGFGTSQCVAEVASCRRVTGTWNLGEWVFVLQETA